MDTSDQHCLRTATVCCALPSQHGACKVLNCSGHCEPVAAEPAVASSVFAIWLVWVSQNHRSVALEIKSNPPQPRSRQGQLEQVAQDHAQLGYQYLQGWRLHILSEQSVPVFEHPHSKKSLYLCFSGISCAEDCSPWPVTTSVCRPPPGSLWALSVFPSVQPTAQAAASLISLCQLHFQHQCHSDISCLDLK